MPYPIDIGEVHTAAAEQHVRALFAGFGIGCVPDKIYS